MLQLSNYDGDCRQNTSNAKGFPGDGKLILANGNNSSVVGRSPTRANANFIAMDGYQILLPSRVDDNVCPIPEDSTCNPDNPAC